MKPWEKYRRFLRSGCWHTHTQYSDGESTIDEYCRTARKLKVPLIAFTDHATERYQSNIHAFMSELDQAREEYPDIVLLAGAEINVLQDGNLNVSDKVLSQLDYVLAAFHKFPVDKLLYLSAVKQVMRNRKVSAWAHPGLELKKGIEISTTECLELMQAAEKNNVLVELNSRASMPTPEWRRIGIMCGVTFVNGPDHHAAHHMYYNYKGGI